MLNDDQKFGKNENFRVFSGSAGRPLPDGRLTAHFFSARLGGAPSVFRLAGSAAHLTALAAEPASRNTDGAPPSLRGERERERVETPRRLSRKRLSRKRTFAKAPFAKAHSRRSAFRRSAFRESAFLESAFRESALGGWLGWVVRVGS